MTGMIKNPSVKAGIMSITKFSIYNNPIIPNTDKIHPTIPKIANFLNAFVLLRILNMTTLPTTPETTQHKLRMLV